MNRSPRPVSTSKSTALAVAAALLMALAACSGGDDEAGTRDGPNANDGQASELPAPEGAIGSVTGMPAHPGPGTTPMTGVPDATLGDAPATMEGGAEDPGLTWVEDPAAEGVLLLTDDPAAAATAATPVMPAPPPPQSPVPPQAAVIPPPPADPSRTVPIGTERATESTTFVVEPAEAGDDD